MFALHDLKTLLATDGAGPCVSLYMPTHRQHPDNQQDPIRFRNLVKRATDSLFQDGDSTAAQTESLLAKFHDLAADGTFWNHTADGMAVFGSPEFFRIVRLQRPVPEIAIVASSFHVKPLLRIAQSADRFQLLCVNRRDVRLFEGNRDALDEVDLAADVPRTATDVLGEDLPEPEGQAHSYGTGPSASGAGAARGAGGAKTGGARHGHGSKGDVIDQQTERFFREVDRAVIEHHSKPSGLPLVLAALPEYHAPFRALSHNAQLIDSGIAINPEALTTDELRLRVWQEVMEPAYVARLASLVERFSAARATKLSDDRLPQVAEAAAAGRVGTLLLEAQRLAPGRLDATTGALQPAAIVDPDVDDMLDDLAELVMGKGGEVVIVPLERMPTTSGLAAIYRF